MDVGYNTVVRSSSAVPRSSFFLLYNRVQTHPTEYITEIILTWTLNNHPIPLRIVIPNRVILNRETLHVDNSTRDMGIHPNNRRNILSTNPPTTLSPKCNPSKAVQKTTEANPQQYSNTANSNMAFAPVSMISNFVVLALGVRVFSLGRLVPVLRIHG